MSRMSEMVERVEDILTMFPDRISPEPNSGCWLWTASENGRGYGRLKRDGKYVAAHRLALSLHLGRKIRGHVLHSCDVPCCVNPAHLTEGSHAENMRDSAKKGRNGMASHPERSSLHRVSVTSYGEKHGNHRHSDEKISEVHRLHEAGLSMRRIGRKLGIHNSHVSRIIRGECRAHRSKQVLRLTAALDETGD